MLKLVAYASETKNNEEKSLKTNFINSLAPMCQIALESMLTGQTYRQEKYLECLVCT